MHAMRVTDEQAMDLMLNDTFQTQTEAEGKSQRPKPSSTQFPTYYLGSRQSWDLLKKYRAAKGSSFTLEEFHNAGLDQGERLVQYLVRILLVGVR